MARRSFSLMLAWRYLNPRRAMLSAVTLISVTGVLLGVLVLVVVMSVYAGLERTVKERLLGFTPHIRLEYVPFGGFREPIGEWRGVAEQVAQTPGVESATAFVQDYVLMVDEQSRKRPVMFRAVDTETPSQVEGISKMLDSAYPGSSADMGLDNRIVVSSVIAKQFQLQLGDKMKFLSAKNLDEVERIDRMANEPPVREKYATALQSTRELLKTSFEERGDKLFLSADKDFALTGPFMDISHQMEGIRDQEREIIERFLALFEAEPAEAGFLLEKSVPEEAAKVLAELDATDVEKMNAENDKSLREIILPKEATVIGVYQASQMALTPDVFMPLPLAQELTGLQDAVQGIAVRLKDPYQAELVANEFVKTLPEGWQLITWIEELGEFSRLINQQRGMMYFVLSFIIVISAFSMMAVMFTVTIQKRREIGVMKALGAAPGQIVKVFVYQGMILGFLGSLLGVGLGLLVVRLRTQLQEGLRAVGFDPFSKSFLGVDDLPAHVNPTEVVVIAISAFILCTVAAFVPAFSAARSDAAKSLRNL
ncbi:ABC transporter permease [Luteolibacter sp. GHJ8]|uniref:ABC transporter permease n=1 Tax=Luteolibacter rhizosphaerae TaxID=2989719 RepID=A0ABT3G028_9BACT|nr:FtsX-like permease family protein [Luteolibacter rhizosphaerae]MCW1913191.1 ABC transporter permease [Luteolibacter rhizosphaerae]